MVTVLPWSCHGLYACRYPDCSIDMVIAAMVRDGCVILRNLVSAEVCEQMITEMSPYCEQYKSTMDGNKAKRPGLSITN